MSHSIQPSSIIESSDVEYDSSRVCGQTDAKISPRIFAGSLDIGLEWFPLYDAAWVGA